MRRLGHRQRQVLKYLQSGKWYSLQGVAYHVSPLGAHSLSAGYFSVRRCEQKGWLTIKNTSLKDPPDEWVKITDKGLERMVNDNQMEEFRKWWE